jgi:hypothetical protein
MLRFEPCRTSYKNARGSRKRDAFTRGFRPVKSSDGPDCRIDLGSERLGIEVTQLFSTSQQTRFSPRDRWNTFNTAYSGGPTNSRRFEMAPI